jgi:hypothetical protein
MDARTLSAAELLDVWERGADEGVVERAVRILSTAHDAPTIEVLRWPVGVRDAQLLRFRARKFGPTLDIVTECPHCSESAEAEVPIGELLAGQEDSAVIHEARLDDGDIVVRFRPANSEDLLHAARIGDPAALIERCVERVDGEPEPGAIEALLANALADADPLADLALDMICPSCGEAWTSPLDPPSFLWREIDAWARRTLSQIHTLASAYGWTEGEILALGPARRAAYLEMLP